MTKDEDSARRGQQAGRGPEVLWLRVAKTSNRTLPAQSVPRLPGIVGFD